MWDQGPPKQIFCFLSRSRYWSERGRSGKVHSDAFLNTLPNARGLWLRIFLTATLPEWAGLLLSSQKSLCTCCRKSLKLRGAFGPLVRRRSSQKPLLPMEGHFHTTTTMREVLILAWVEEQLELRGREGQTLNVTSCTAGEWLVCSPFPQWSAWSALALTWPDPTEQCHCRWKTLRHLFQRAVSLPSSFSFHSCLLLLL